MDIATIQLDEPGQLEQTAAQAGQVFAAGGLVVFPTETVYGIGASVASSEGYAALRRFKGRDDDQPFTIHLPTPAAAERYIDMSSPIMRRLVQKVFPGPVTLVVDVDDATIADRVKAMGLPPSDAGEGESRGGRHLIYHHNTVGLRCPDDEAAQAILASVDAPIVASSANRRGEPPPQDADAAEAAVGDGADMIVRGERCRYAKPSTIVRVKQTDRGPHITVQREGVYDERYIRKMLRWTMLVVCSGNTCRSPMAEAIAKQLLADRRGIAVDELEAAGLEVISAGTYAAPGQPPSEEAVEALAKMDIDLSGHRSRRVTLEMIEQADVIYCMTQGHLEMVLHAAPSAADKVMLLDPNGDVDDPIGAGLTIYQRCAEVIRRRLDQRIKEQQP